MSVLLEPATVYQCAEQSAFQPNLNKESYPADAYKLAMRNTKYDESGKAVIEKNDDWKNETEWDDIFVQMKAERGANRRLI